VRLVCYSFHKKGFPEPAGVDEGPPNGLLEDGAPKTFVVDGTPNTFPLIVVGAPNTLALEELPKGDTPVDDGVPNKALVLFGTALDGPNTEAVVAGAPKMLLPVLPNGALLPKGVLVLPKGELLVVFPNGELVKGGPKGEGVETGTKLPDEGVIAKGLGAGVVANGFGACCGC